MAAISIILLFVYLRFHGMLQGTDGQVFEPTKEDCDYKGEIKARFAPEYLRDFCEKLAKWEADSKNQKDYKDTLTQHQREYFEAVENCRDLNCICEKTEWCRRLMPQSDATEASRAEPAPESVPDQTNPGTNPDSQSGSTGQFPSHIESVPVQPSATFPATEPPTPVVSMETLGTAPPNQGTPKPWRRMPGSFGGGPAGRPGAPPAPPPQGAAIFAMGPPFFANGPATTREPVRPPAPTFFQRNRIEVTTSQPPSETMATAETGEVSTTTSEEITTPNNHIPIVHLLNEPVPETTANRVPVIHMFTKATPKAVSTAPITEIPDGQFFNRDFVESTTDDQQRVTYDVYQENGNHGDSTEIRRENQDRSHSKSKSSERDVTERLEESTTTVAKLVRWFISSRSTRVPLTSTATASSTSTERRRQDTTHRSGGSDGQIEQSKSAERKSSNLQRPKLQRVEGSDAPEISPNRA